VGDFELAALLVLLLLNHTHTLLLQAPKRHWISKMVLPELSTPSVPPSSHSISKKCTKIVKKKKSPRTLKPSQPGQKPVAGLLNAAIPDDSNLMEMSLRLAP
jgi:hypothetical protein